MANEVESPMTTRNTRRFEFKLGKIGMFFFVLGISGLLFGVFLLGVTVGKNIDIYPEKIAGFLPDRIRTLIHLSRETSEPVMNKRDSTREEKQEPDVDLTYHERLAKGKQGEAPPPQEPMAPAVQPKSSALVPAAEGEAPVTEKPVLREEFLVQVVSYQEKSKAETLIKKIAGMGYRSRMEVIDLPDKGKWFRVVMGGFPSRSEAQNAVNAVSKKNKGLNCVIRSAGGTGN